MNLAEISFPVFRLASKPEQHEGLMYYYTETFNKDTAQFTRKVRILDDKAIPHNTLSRRRLVLSEDEVALYPLRKGIFGLGDLIRLSKSNTWWIDSNGKIFQYKKSKYVPLQCRRIKQIIPSKTIGSIIEVEGIGQRFRTIFRVSDKDKYAILLKIGASYVFYGTSETEIKNAVRKI
jgi:hypothetical protein